MADAPERPAEHHLWHDVQPGHGERDALEWPEVLVRPAVRNVSVPGALGQLAFGYACNLVRGSVVQQTGPSLCVVLHVAARFDAPRVFRPGYAMRPLSLGSRSSVSLS